MNQMMSQPGDLKIFTPQSLGIGDYWDRYKNMFLNEDQIPLRSLISTMPKMMVEQLLNNGFIKDFSAIRDDQTREEFEDFNTGFNITLKDGKRFNVYFPFTKDDNSHTIKIENIDADQDSLRDFLLKYWIYCIGHILSYNLHAIKAFIMQHKSVGSKEEYSKLGGVQVKIVQDEVQRLHNFLKPIKALLSDLQQATGNNDFDHLL
jgi:ribosomal protein S8